MVRGKPWTIEDDRDKDKECDSSNNKWRNTELAAAAVGITCVALVAWSLVLGAAEWTAGGVAAGTFSSVLRLIMLTLPCIGSIAAVVQGANVAAGSLFALAQSAGAEGTVAGVIDGAIVGAGGATAVREAFRGEETEYEDDGKDECEHECKDNDKGGKKQEV
jgi:hypothetical protein